MSLRPTAREAMRLAMHKLPIKTRFVVRQDEGVSDGDRKQLSCVSSTTPSCEQRLGEAKEELFNLRFQNATGQLDNIAPIPQVRREVARIETLLREREIAAAEAAGSEEYVTGRRDDHRRHGHTPARCAKASSISTKMDKTVVVAVVDRVRHRRYGKTMQRTSKLYAHDEANEVREGDRVRIAGDPPAVEARSAGAS